MPYRANADRRHKFSRVKYRVTNWPVYDAALVRRGSLTLCGTEEAVEGWQAPVTGRRGGQAVYSERVGRHTGTRGRAILVDLFGARGADDRSRGIRLAQHPGEGKLRQRQASVGRERLDPLHRFEHGRL